MKHPRMRRARWPLLVLGILMVLHTALWWTATEILTARFEAWRSTQLAEGWTVRSAARAHGGWPFAATLDLAQSQLIAPNGGIWRAERVRLMWQPAAPFWLTIETSGRQQVTLAPVSAEIVVALARLDWPLRPSAGPVSLTVSGAVFQNGATDHARATLTDDGTAVRLHLAMEGFWTRGIMLDRVTADGILTPRLTSGSPRTIAATWRDRGGVLTIERLTARAGTSALDATARLNLDAALQPAGGGTVRLVQPAGALRQLTETGVLTPSVATAAGAVIGLLTRPGPDAGSPEAELPWTVRDGVLAAGPVPVLRLPPLRW